MMYSLRLEVFRTWRHFMFAILLWSRSRRTGASWDVMPPSLSWGAPCRILSRI